MSSELDFQALRGMKEDDRLTPLQFRDEDDREEIMRARLGMVTGSEFGKLVVKTKDKKGYTLSSGETAIKLIYRTAWERLLKQGNISNGLGRLNVNSPSLQHGIDYEGEAILKYMERTGNTVDYVQKFIEYDDFIGGTPDGYIGDDGIIEVKCPMDGGNHIRAMLTGEIYNPDHVFQVQGYLWITGRQWCDYITYDPDLIDRLQLNIIHVERDEGIIAGISQVMEQVKRKVQKIMLNEHFNYGTDSDIRV